MALDLSAKTAVVSGSTAMIHYGVTKTVQVALARCIAESCAGTGVTVKSVLPAPTKSEGVAVFAEQLVERQNVDEAEMERQFFATARPSSRLKRSITCDEVANHRLFVHARSIGYGRIRAARDGGEVRAIA